jgi:hypothetical protein
LEKPGDKKKFWLFVKSVAHGKSSIPEHHIKDEFGTLTSDLKKKAKLFADHYFSRHNAPAHELNEGEARMEEIIENTIKQEDPNELNLSFTMSEHGQTLDNLPDKAMDVNRIHKQNAEESVQKEQADLTQGAQQDAPSLLHPAGGM